MSTRVTVVVCSLLSVVSPIVSAKEVHLVDMSGGGDFSTIQDAIDFASPGDVVHVVPADDAYGAIILEKGLKIHGLGSEHVRLDGFRVRFVPYDERASLSNFQIVRDAEPEIADCEGEVVLDRILHQYSPHGLTIRRSDDVSVNHSTFRPRSQILNLATGSGINVFTSQARFESCLIRGFSTNFIHGMGNPGMIAHASNIVLSRTTVIGGNGADESINTDSGNGGVGLLLRLESTAFILGTPENLIQGGRGGDDSVDQAGFGGHAIDADEGSTVRISEVVLERGEAGLGNPDGLPGFELQGGFDFLRDDRWPLLDAGGSLVPGGHLDLQVSSAFPDTAVLMLISNGSDWRVKPQWVGPPLSVGGDAGVFFAYQAGLTDEAGDLLTGFGIPGGALFDGFLLHAQAVLLTGPELLLSNSIERVIASE